MTIDLSKVNFAYDFFSSTMPDGSTLILNNVSENFTSSKGEETIVKQVTIVIAPVGEDNNILCSSVIGTGNSKILLDTKYEEYKGKVLTADNMKYCTIEMFEEDND